MKRYILAGGLIFLVILLQPVYLKWLGYETPKSQKSDEVADFNEKAAPAPAAKLERFKEPIRGVEVPLVMDEHFMTISTPLYIATISNRSGGSFVDFVLNETNSTQLKYRGSYSENGIYNADSPVSIIMPSKESCQPCLGYFDDSLDDYRFYNQPFLLRGNYASGDTVYLGYGETQNFIYSLQGPNGNVLIERDVHFSADSYIINQQYSLNDYELDYSGYLELLWRGGLRPTEARENEDIQYSAGIISQAGEIEDIKISDADERVFRQVFNGQTEWAAVRTKYFMSALLADNPGKYAVLSAHSRQFGERSVTPVYHASIGFPYNITSISADLYLGPLDIDQIRKTGSNLEDTMDFGFSLIRPISKSILWLLKFTHNSLNLNYGLVLILFALLIRLITGPLTNKSYESSQKMQKIQPQVKAVQAKFKSDPQKMNKEVMALYKKHGVNPLGGCLPILLQMPLLWALFVVFRSTIEFRGASFILWISDLSQPDVVINLPFSIPIYGDGVAILPLIMGATLMMTMRMSSATMDKTQKPMMYFMNGFFILLFNTFPSGLNLYYTAYNILSFLQQRTIRKKLAA